MPAVQSRFEKILGRPTERTVDPMQCVALGAAIQAAVLSGEVKDILLLDVTPLSLGVETKGGIFTKLIERNTTIPTRKSETFTTAADGQTSVEVHVLQGERAMAGDNVSLGRFYLTGIPPAPAGVPKIEVTFDIDANGILNVSAKDMATGKTEKLTIVAPQRRDKGKIDSAVRDAESHAEEDRRRREFVELRNHADQLVYATEKLLKEHGSAISEGTRNAVEEKLEALRKVLTTDDISVLRAAIDALNQEAQKIGVEMYGKGGPAEAPPPGVPGRDQASLPPAREEAPSGPEQGQPEGRGREVQADLRGVRGPRGRREASHLRPVRRGRPQAAGLGRRRLRLVPVHPCRGCRGHLRPGPVRVVLRSKRGARWLPVRAVLRRWVGLPTSRPGARPGRPRRGRAGPRGGRSRRTEGGHGPLPDDLPGVPRDGGRGGAPRHVSDVQRPGPGERLPATGLQSVHHDHDVPEVQRARPMARATVSALPRGRKDRGDADDRRGDPARRPGRRPASGPRPRSRGRCRGAARRPLRGGAGPPARTLRPRRRRHPVRTADLLLPSGPGRGSGGANPRRHEPNADPRGDSERHGPPAPGKRPP